MGIFGARIKKEFYLSEKFRAFGNKVVLITNATEFSKRIQKGLDSNPDIDRSLLVNQDGIAGAPVKYVSRKEHHGKMGIFTKFDEYKWQYEWRIAIRQTKVLGPYKFKIGGLSDIVKVCDVDIALQKPIKLIYSEGF